MMDSSSGHGITALTAADAARMAQLHLDAFPPGESWDARQFSDLLAQDSVIASGLVQAGKLVSFILIQIAADQAEILTLATAPGKRRSGLAGTLLSQVEATLAQRGISIWLLDVAADNAPGLKLYARNGFSTDGRRRDYYQRVEGKRVDAILMSKRMARQGIT
ncbi:MAG: GNAT family N-acetyltransferase [Hyphomonas sp.]|nr:GNAT family N-acetyltransferase [Hyphomonas sp.]